MNGLSRKFKIVLIICLFIVGAFFVFSYVSAQDTFGLQPVEQNIGLAATDIRTIIAKIIRAILGILGIIALAVVLYGGFVYMTAGGNEEKVSQARKILINGIIGLIIILSAFAIVQFVINKLAGATGLVTEAPAACENIDYALSHPQICGADVDFPDDCAKNHFVVKSITPRTDDTGMNNVAIRAIFSQKIQYQNGNIKIYFNETDISNQFNFAVLGNGAKDENALVEALYQGVSKCKDGTFCLPFGKYKVSVSPEMKAQNSKTLESQTECGSYPSDGEFEIKKPAGEVFDMGEAQNYVLDFDGVDDYLTMPAINISSGSFTLEAWVYPKLDSPDSYAVLMSYDFKRRWLLRNDGKLLAQFGDTMVKNFFSNSSLTANQWSHIVYKYDASVNKHYFYINGAYDNEDAVEGGIPTWAKAFEIGRFYTATKIWYKLHGLMDEVRIYNQALALEEIQVHYNNGKGKKGIPGEQGLLAGWHFDEGTGATINDFSGNNKNGEIHGASWEFIAAAMTKDEIPPVLSALQVTDKDGNAVEPGSLARGRTYYLKSDITDNSGAGYTHLNINSTSGANLNEYDGPRVERGSDAPLSNPYKFSYPFFLPSNLASGQYTFKIEAFDIDSNSAFKELSIVVVPVNCHDGVMNGDETGIDEGGSCGLTEGSECTQDYQCASQKCVDGKCVAFPIITSVDAWDGAPGNWITILGRYFGNTAGTVEFGYDSDNNGLIDNSEWTPAQLAACQSGDVWNNNWVIVEVPQTLLQGDKVIRLTSANNYSVTTKDKRNVDKYFIINDVNRPGLCSVKTLDNAKAGSPKTAIQATGKNFGDTQGNSSLNFGNTKAGVQNWADGLISAFVPNLQPGKIGVYVKVGNEKSNGVPFTILKEGEEAGPIISAIEPSSVTPKSYITISGKNFGDSGEIWLADSSANAKTCVGTSPSGNCKELNANLPAVCGKTWSDEQVIVEVPDETSPANYYLILENDLGQSTAGENDKLEIKSGEPMPGICKLNPASGPAPRPIDSPLKIYGINFGGNPVLYFWTKNSESNDLSSWLSENAIITTGHIETSIPVSESGYSMQTGPIKVKANGQLGNSIKYSVEDCKNLKTIPEGFHCCDKGPDAGVLKLGQVACEGEVREAGYVWRFATGIIPKLPYVVESCDGSTFPSPTPWTKWPQGKEACLNSTIAVRFSMGMDKSALNSSNVKVYKCSTAQDGGINCGTTKTQLPSSDLALDYESEVLTIRWAPPNLESNTWYHVELSDAITSLETKQELGVDKELKQPLKISRPCGAGTAYCFDFKTGNGTCTLTGAGINPPSYTTNLLGVIQDPRFAFDFEHPFAPHSPAMPYYYYVWGQGSQECSVLNVDGLGWNWASSNSSKATVALSPSLPKYTDSRAKVTALANTVPNSVKITVATTTAESLIKAESNLIIDLSDPKVVEFWPNCGEACINAEIGAGFNQMMVTITYDGGIKLYQCLDEFCADKNLVDNVLAVNPEFSDFTTLRAYINDPYLEANTWYLVELTADIKAIGAFDENGLIKEGKSLEPFQWKFRTKADNTPCQISTVQIIPSPFTAYFIGEKTKYMSFPHGSPDSCSPFGQSLNPWSFGWQWLTGNASVAEVTEFSTADKLKPYCDLLCLPAGSDIEKGKQVSICGNGIVEAGEDCDIGIAGEVAGISCGYNCLRPGNNDATTCGNGIIEPEKGEECETTTVSPNYSLSFDGSDDYVQVSSLDISSGSFSLEAWINSKLDEAGNYGTIMGYDGSHRILVQNSGLLLTQFGGNFFSQGKVKANEWSHVVYKYDSADNKEYFYVNGEFDSEHTPTAVPVWNSAFKIGQYDLIHYKFHGLIDEVRVYNKALSESDIKAHYNQGKGQKGESGELGLVAGWHFDEGDGLSASDFSGNNKDGQLMGGTAWSNESPIVSEAVSMTYCNANCTNKGSSTKQPGGDLSKSWCGSGSITAGEECEGEVGCSSNCLHIGTALSQNWCDNKTGAKPKECDKAISICGNSIVESGEECEVTDTNKIKIHGGTGEITTSAEAGKICTAKCLLQNICNEINIPASLRCNKDAQDCKDDCTLWGSSPNFSTPSLCGDGISGMGEYGFCEISLSADILGQNPVQAVTAIGNGEENPQTRRQETLISAKAVSFRNKNGAKEDLASDKQKTGQGNYYLQCGNTEFDGQVEGKYNDCVLPGGASVNAFGVGANSCCYQRSERKEEYPQDGAGFGNSAGVCRNTYIEVKLNGEIDSQSLDKNIILASGHEAGYNCVSSIQPDQSKLINALLAKADGSPAGFWQKLWQAVKRFFAGLFGQEATATKFNASDLASEVWCGSEKDVRAEMHYATNTSIISIYINNLLEPNREYAVILKSEQKGIKDARGVGIRNKDSNDKLDDIWFFKTGNQVCKLQAIKVFPDSYWFNKPDAAMDFQAITQSANGQQIVATTAYSWNWYWAPAGNPVFAIPSSDKQVDATNDLVTIKSRNVEGTIKAVAQAKVIIDKDSQNNQLDKVFTGTSDLLAKFCENPWPAPVGDDWQPFTDNVYNFSMSYCADAGKSGNIADDLPFLNDEIISTVKTEDSLKKILFFNSQNDDVFGVQILENPKRLSALAWFKEQFPNAPAPQQITIAGFDAVQNGDNYYINGLNLVGDSLYNNIYLFSLNKGAQADSKKMLEQILQSLQFNINITNHGYCLNSGATLSANPNDINDQYICQTDFECLDINGSAKPGASGVCSNAKTKFFRDLRRLYDIQKAQSQLTAYYNKNSKYPDLKSGTYIPGYTVSKWPSWGKLGSAIGGLPLEPVNYWAGCGANMLPTGMISWWKANGDANDALDRSGGEALQGVGYAAGKAGQAFSFDGVDDYVSIIDDYNPVAYTIAAWVKPAEVAPMNIFVRTGEKGPGVQWSHQLRINAAGKFEHYVFANNMLSVSGTTVLSPDSWYHVAGVAANNGALKLYVNGVEEGKAVNIGTLWTGGDRYNIGSFSAGMSYFSGLIDEITLYDRALSPTEIQSLYNYGNYGENNSDIDQQTCWNAKQSVYVCPYAANVYEYEFNKTSGDYLIHGPLEYFNENDAVADAFLDTGHFTTNRWCSPGQVFSPFGEKCGDGIVQTAKGENCDPPGATKLVSSYTDSNGTLINCAANQQATATCASNCAWTYGQCEKIGVCGNGVVEGDEFCDDGTALNGTYGHCNGDCSGQHGQFCGNETIDIKNGKPLEFCDKSEAIYQQGFCSDKFERGCNNNDECKETEIIDYGKCISAVPPLISAHCEKSLSMGCTTDADCTLPIVHSYGSCWSVNEPSYSYNKDKSCSWDCQNYGSYCGDGKKDALYEECDDGNANDNDKCKNNCTLNSSPVTEPESKPEQACGNGVVDANLNEICDLGADNGKACKPAYSKSCVWCSADCKKKYTVDAVAYCGNGEIDNRSIFGQYLVFDPEPCDVNAQGVVLEGYVTKSNLLPTGIGSNEKICSDKGKYECLNHCTELKDNCVQCGEKEIINGGVSPKIALLNPMIGKEIKWPYSGLEMVGLYTTSSAPSNLGYKTLISSFESGEQQILTGFSIESSPLCKEEYKVHFNYPDIFNFLHPPSGFTNLLQFNNDWNEIKPYGDVFPYPVNNESDVVENELIMSPAVPEGTFRVVVRWTNKENDKGASFAGLLYSDDFYTDINKEKSYFIVSYAQAAIKTGNWDNLCRTMGLENNYWMPKSEQQACFKYNDSIFVHDSIGLEKTFIQSFTVNPDSTKTESIAFFVQNLNGYIAPFKNSNLEVEVYQFHPGQSPQYSIYQPTIYSIQTAAGTSSNSLARYWHVFNLEKIGSTYQVVPVETIETDFCQVLENMPGTVKCGATGQ